MGTNIVKIVSLFLIMLVSLHTSSSFVEKHVVDVKTREKTLADAMLKKEMEEKLKEAEQLIAQAQEESNLVIKTEKVEMKPVKEEAESEVREEPPSDIETESDSLLANNYQKVVDGLKSGVDLSANDLELLGDFLIDNYFLNGKKYITSELNQEIKEKKTTVNQMESYVIKSLHSAMDILKIVVSKNYEEIESIKGEIMAQSEGFSAKFLDKTAENSQYKQLYENINNYFSSCLGAVTKVEGILTTAQNSTNPTLAAGVVLAGIDKEVIPSFKLVLNKGIDIKEQINKVYLEGVQGKELLTKDQVLNIISLL